MIKDQFHRFWSYLQGSNKFLRNVGEPPHSNKSGTHRNQHFEALIRRVDELLSDPILIYPLAGATQFQHKAFIPNTFSQGSLKERLQEAQVRFEASMKAAEARFELAMGYVGEPSFSSNIPESRKLDHGFGSEIDMPQTIKVGQVARGLSVEPDGGEFDSSVGDGFLERRDDSLRNIPSGWAWYDRVLKPAATDCTVVPVANGKPSTTVDYIAEPLGRYALN